MFKIFEKIGNITYNLKMLEHLSTSHLVFHAIQLIPYKLHEEDLGKVGPSRVLAMISYRPK